MSAVLIVDDQPDLCAVLVRLLRDEGFDVDYALDGPGAMNHMRSHVPALVLLDVMMPPGPSGLDVLRAIRVDPRMRTVPVVMYSGSGDPGMREVALAMGADGYLVKSLATFEDLLRAAAMPRRTSC